MACTEKNVTRKNDMSTWLRYDIRAYAHTQTHTCVFIGVQIYLYTYADCMYKHTCTWYVYEKVNVGIKLRFISKCEN